MSISRKNWSALSSLTRQWTMEDEEEVEREKRRRVKSSTSVADPDDDVSLTSNSTTDSTSGSEKSSDASQSLSSEEQLQLDFVEMLRVRDEKRRMRHVETLRQQKEVEEGGKTETSRGGGGGGGRGEGARVAILGDIDVEQDSVFQPQPALKKTSYSTTLTSSTNGNRSSVTSTQRENGALSAKDRDPKPPSRSIRKFVSSVSISLDKSPSVSETSTPMSPRSPAATLSPREQWPSPCQSPVHNGHTQENNANGSSTNGNFEQTSKPAFIRQSSRTLSFRMMRKKEEETSPLQRSSSVRMASKKFEPNTDQNTDKGSPFQRNCKQRTSSRSIQEKMDRLAQAAQKSEVPRSADVTQRTLFLLEEVSRKRGLFEKEQAIHSPTSPGVSRQDLRHVDISSKKSLFENRGEDYVSKVSPGKIYK